MDRQYNNQYINREGAGDMNYFNGFSDYSNGDENNNSYNQYEDYSHYGTWNNDIEPFQINSPVLETSSLSNFRDEPVEKEIPTNKLSFASVVGSKNSSESKNIYVTRNENRNYNAPNKYICKYIGWDKVQKHVTVTVQSEFNETTFGVDNVSYIEMLSHPKYIILCGSRQKQQDIVFIIGANPNSLNEVMTGISHAGSVVAILNDNILLQTKNNLTLKYSLLNQDFETDIGIDEKNFITKFRNGNKNDNKFVCRNSNRTDH